MIFRQPKAGRHYQAAEDTSSKSADGLSEPEVNLMICRSGTGVLQAEAESADENNMALGFP